MQNAISVDRISKRFALGEREAYGSLRDSLVRAAKAPLAWLPGAPPRAAAPEMWALHDVSFEVGEGHILGVIGRNGSGKSTLLKILSRIMEPTSGRAIVRGRVGSLLEVGTGFHPELTGRENVFVNGAILGMRKREIARKFDEIVAFADMDRFIDTPVKRYSSGMQMRLAFAVAAHLEPEILLVDEVLAVGDLEFQRKCLGKMDDVSRDGRTILFVSHQMNQLRRLCSHCVWLDRGRLIDVGPAAELITRYEASFLQRPSVQSTSGAGTSFVRWTLGEGDEPQHTLSTFGPFTLRLLLRLDRHLKNGHHGLTLHDADNRVLWGASTDNIRLEPGVHEIVYRIETLPLRPGAYRWLATIYEDEKHLDSLDGMPELIVDTPPLGHRRDEWAGLLNLPHTVSIVPTAAALAQPAAPRTQATGS